MLYNIKQKAVLTLLFAGVSIALERFLPIDTKSEYTPLAIAHQGAKGYATGNTFEAYQKAIDLGSSMIELDVQMCESGEIVVYHDRILSNGEFVRDTNLTYIRELQNSFYDSDAIAPTIGEVLAFIDGLADVYFDLKDNVVLTPLLEMLQVASASDNNWKLGGGQFHIAAFNHNQLVDAKQVIRHTIELKDVQLIALISSLPIGYAENLDLDLNTEGQKSLNAISIDSNVVTKEFVADAHQRGIKVYVWTANAPNLVAHLKYLRVDGIVSDYPDRVM